MPLGGLLTPRTYYNEQIVSTPKNTNDQSTTVNLGFKVLQQVMVLWPPGVNALTGVAFALDGVQIVPFGQTGAFVFDSATRRTFDVGMLLNHPIVVHTHNADTVAHSLFITFVLEDVPDNTEVTPPVALPTLL